MIEVMHMQKPVVGYPGYEVSDDGRIVSYLSGKPIELKTFENYRGYPRVGLMKEGKQKLVFVHRLVATSFIGEIPNGYTVNHIDGDKSNNKLCNLEIVTHKENCLHSSYELKNGIKPVLMIDPEKLRILAEFESITTASNITGVDDGGIARCCKGNRNMAGGYLWSYKENYNKEFLKTQKDNHANYRHERRKPVLQIDQNTNEIIRTFAGVREAKKLTGISTISHCLTGRTKTAGGFIWKVKEEGY